MSDPQRPARPSITSLLAAARTNKAAAISGTTAAGMTGFAMLDPDKAILALIFTIIVLGIGNMPTIIRALTTSTAAATS